MKKALQTRLNAINAKVLGASVLLAAPALSFAQSTGIDTAAATAVLTDNKEKLIAVAVVVFGIFALIMILRKIGSMFK